MKRRGRATALSAGLAWTLCASALGISAASATSLGGLAPQSLMARTMVGTTGAKTVIAWENFNGANGTSIAGTTTDGGARIWAANPAATWTISGNAARTTTANRSLVINPSQWNYTSEVRAFRGGTNFDGGLTINRNSAGSEFITCEWTSNSNGSMEIWRFSGGGWAQWAGVANLYPGGIATAPASIVIGCGTNSTSVYATIDGVQVAAYTLTLAERTTFFRAANQLTGPYQWLATTMTFDDFHVDNP